MSSSEAFAAVLKSGCIIAKLPEAVRRDRWERQDERGVEKGVGGGGGGGGLGLKLSSSYTEVIDGRDASWQCMQATSVFLSKSTAEYLFTLVVSQCC